MYQGQGGPGFIPGGGVLQRQRQRRHVIDSIRFRRARPKNADPDWLPTQLNVTAQKRGQGQGGEPFILICCVTPEQVSPATWAGDLLNRKDLSPGEARLRGAELVLGLARRLLCLT